MPSGLFTQKRPRWPISVRLTLWYGLSLTVLLALFAGVLLTALHFNQHILLHQRLFQAQADLMPHVTVASETISFQPSLDSLATTYGREGPLGLYVRLMSPSGDVLTRSANFGEQDGFAPHLPDSDRMAEIEFFWDDQRFRSMYAPVLDRSGAVAGWLEVSSFSFQIHRQLWGRPLILAILLTVALALIGGYVLARRALKPVAALTEAATRIHAADLSVRLPIHARYRDELTDLAETFNTMLDRLEAAFERERRFTANAAHEILNPLASVRNEAEVALRRSRDDDAYRHALHTILSESRRLGHLLEHLLHLAHLDADTDVSRERIDLGTLVEQQMPRWQERAGRQDVAVQIDVAGPAPVTANAAHLNTVLDNLFDNAVKYTPAGGSVRVGVHTEDDQVILTVRDTGVGFLPEQAVQLFDRFYRADVPEVQAHAGSGLGLALVQAIVGLYGGSITAHSDGLHQGSTFTARLPRATTDDASMETAPTGAMADEGCPPSPT